MARRKELTKAQDVMLEHFALINFSENRPACWRDFLLFEVNGKHYTLKHGTIRNHFSYLKRFGRIKLVCRDINAYYSLAEASMTLPPYRGHHTQNPVRQQQRQGRDITSLIARMPFDTPAVHNIRLSFSCPELWDNLHQQQQEEEDQLSMRSVSKDLVMPPEHLDLDKKKAIAYITIHKTNTVTIILKCSESPIPLDPAGLIRLNCSLVAVYERLRWQVYNHLIPIPIPHPDTWTIAMWHLNRDSLERYEGEKFHITVDGLNGELLRAYSKTKEEEERGGGRGQKRYVRIERQEYPNVSVKHLVEKLLSSSSNNEGATEA